MIKVESHELSPTFFPDNTTQVWHLPEELFRLPCVVVTWEFQRTSEFLELAQLKTLLDHKKIRAQLVIRYLPYGRQDKPVSNIATFALTTFAHLLNSLSFEKVFILDPHSKVATYLINSSEEIYPKKSVDELVRDLGVNTLCYPDKGACAKYAKVYPRVPYIRGRKVRDQETGKILNYELVGDCRGKKVLIVDDICDGGMTFVLLSGLLREAEEVHLFCTYGIFSKGLRPLKQAGIERIFTHKGEAFEYQEHVVYKPFLGGRNEAESDAFM